MMRILPCGVFLFLFAVVPAATAQIISNPAQWYVNNQIYSTRVFNGVVANSMLRGARGGKTVQRSAPRLQSKPARDITAFKSAPGNSLPQKLAAKSAAGNGRETEQLLESFIDLYKQTAQKDGFPANDLAYAFEYYVVNNYQIYHDLVELPAEKDPRARRARDGFERIEILNNKKLRQVSPAQERAIFQQFREILAASPEVQKMTDAQKREATELMAIMLGVNFAGYMKGINDGDEELAGEARQLAKDGLEKLLGVPVGQIRITANGLEL